MIARHMRWTVSLFPSALVAVLLLSFVYLSRDTAQAPALLASSQERSTATSVSPSGVGYDIETANAAGQATRLEFDSRTSPRQIDIAADDRTGSKVAEQLALARAHIEAEHERLFHRLGHLPPEKLDVLKVLLTSSEAGQRQLAANIALQAVASFTDPAAEFARIQAERDRAIEALLGAEDFGRYASYQKSYPYRETIDEVTTMMRARGTPVPDALQERITDVYAEAISRAAELSAGDMQVSDWNSMSDPERDRVRMQQLTRFDQILAETTGRLLSPAEHRAFMDAQFVQESARP